MSENIILQKCVNELLLMSAKEKKKGNRTPATIETMRKRGKEVYKQALALQKAYITEEINYKSIGAPAEAIQANAERRELIKRVLNLCGELERQLAIKAATHTATGPNIRFTIY